MSSQQRDHEIQTTATRVVYENRWMKVREDDIVRQDGSQGIYGVVDKKDFALIVPFLDDRLILVEQYRYPVKGRYWEFPQGSWEDSSIAPEDLARAELEEETGYSADKIRHLGYLFAAYGFSSQGYDIFVAEGLSQAAKNLDPEEIGLVSKSFSVADVKTMILDRTIKDASTIAAFGLLLLHSIV